MERSATAGGTGLIVILGLLTAFGPMSIDLYLPGLPALAADLAASPAAARQSVSLFFIGLAAGQLLYGPLSDRYGRRPLLVLGIVLYLVASLGCALAPGLSVLLAGRLAQGLGAAAGPVVARAVIRDVYHGSEAARALSFVVLVMAIAPLLAPLVGGHLVATLGWRSLFWILSAFALLCLAVATFALAETNGAERRGEEPLRTRFAAYALVLGNRESLAFLVCGGAAFGALFAYVASSAFVYINVHGVSPRAFGVYFAINVLGLVIGNLVNGRLVRRLGYRRLLAIGAGVTLAGSTALLTTSVIGAGGLLAVAIPLFFAVATVGLVGANSVAGLLDAYPHNAGAASALFGFFQFGIGALAGAATGLIGLAPTIDMALVMVACAAVSFGAARRLRRAGPLPRERDAAALDR